MTRDEIDKLCAVGDELPLDHFDKRYPTALVTYSENPDENGEIITIVLFANFQQTETGWMRST